MLRHTADYAYHAFIDLVIYGQDLNRQKFKWIFFRYSEHLVTF